MSYNSKKSVRIINTKGAKARTARQQADALRSEVLSVLAESNAKVPVERRVTPKTAVEVAWRSLNDTRGFKFGERREHMLSELNKFLAAAHGDMSLAAVSPHADLFYVSHPLSQSSKVYSLTASALTSARVQWLLADESIPVESHSLLASALSAEVGSIEHKYAIAGLTASGHLQYLDALVASTYSGGNSYWARSMRAKLQRRDRKGRFAYMGGGLRAMIRRLNGAVSWLTGRVVGMQPDSDTYDMETPDGKLYRVKAAKAEGLKAVLPSAKSPDGYSAPITPLASDAGDIIDESSLVEIEAPGGWSAWGDEQDFEGRKFKAYKHDSGQYSVGVFTNADGSREFVVRRAGDSEDFVGKGSNWADVAEVLRGNTPNEEKRDVKARLEGEFGKTLPEEDLAGMLDSGDEEGAELDQMVKPADAGGEGTPPTVPPVAKMPEPSESPADIVPGDDITNQILDAKAKGKPIRFQYNGKGRQYSKFSLKLDKKDNPYLEGVDDEGNVRRFTLDKIEQFPASPAAAPEMSKPQESLLDKMVRLTKEQGGLTIKANGDVPNDGIMVAVRGTNKEIDADAFFNGGADEEIAAWIKENADMLDSDNFYIGTWHDEENGEVVLDVAERFTDRDAAIKAGQDRNQQAIYDIGAGELIDTGGTGDREADKEEARVDADITPEGQEVRGDDGRGDSGVRATDEAVVEGPAKGLVEELDSFIEGDSSGFGEGLRRARNYINNGEFDEDVETPEQMVARLDRLARAAEAEAADNPNLAGVADLVRRAREGVVGRIQGRQAAERRIIEEETDARPSFDVPEGMHTLDFDKDIAPQFAPERLANRFDEGVLEDALRIALNDPDGEVNMDMGGSEGVYVPAEAVYRALEENGLDAADIARKIYGEPGVEPEIIPTGEAPEIDDIADGMVVPAPVSAPELEEISGETPAEESGINVDNFDEYDLPDLIQNLSPEDKQEFIDNGFDHVPFLPQNIVGMDLPENFVDLDPAPFGADEVEVVEEGDVNNLDGFPVGWTNNPMWLANNFPQEDLLDVFENNLFNPEEPGSGILNFKDEDGDDFPAFVDMRAIRDALQLQGVDTNDVIQKAVAKTAANREDSGFDNDIAELANGFEALGDVSVESDGLQVVHPDGNLGFDIQRDGDGWQITELIPDGDFYNQGKSFKRKDMKGVRALVKSRFKKEDIKLAQDAAVEQEVDALRREDADSSQPPSVDGLFDGEISPDRKWKWVDRSLFTRIMGVPAQPSGWERRSEDEILEEVRKEAEEKALFPDGINPFGGFNFVEPVPSAPGKVMGERSPYGDWAWLGGPTNGQWMPVRAKSPNARMVSYDEAMQILRDNEADKISLTPAEEKDYTRLVEYFYDFFIEFGDYINDDVREFDNAIQDMIDRGIRPGNPEFIKFVEDNFKKFFDIEVQGMRYYGEEVYEPGAFREIFEFDNTWRGLNEDNIDWKKFANILHGTFSPRPRVTPTGEVKNEFPIKIDNRLNNFDNHFMPFDGGGGPFADKNMIQVDWQPGMHIDIDDAGSKAAVDNSSEDYDDIFVPLEELEPGDIAQLNAGKWGKVKKVDFTENTMIVEFENGAVREFDGELYRLVGANVKRRRGVMDDVVQDAFDGEDIPESVDEILDGINNFDFEEAKKNLKLKELNELNDGDIVEFAEGEGPAGRWIVRNASIDTDYEYGGGQHYQGMVDFEPYDDVARDEVAKWFAENGEKPEGRGDFGTPNQLFFEDDEEGNPNKQVVFYNDSPAFSDFPRFYNFGSPDKFGVSPRRQDNGNPNTDVMPDAPIAEQIVDDGIFYDPPRDGGGDVVEVGDATTQQGFEEKLNTISDTSDAYVPERELDSLVQGAIDAGAIEPVPAYEGKELNEVSPGSDWEWLGDNWYPTEIGQDKLVKYLDNNLGRSSADEETGRVITPLNPGTEVGELSPDGFFEWDGQNWKLTKKGSDAVGELLAQEAEARGLPVRDRGVRNVADEVGDIDAQMERFRRENERLIDEAKEDGGDAAAGGPPPSFPGGPGFDDGTTPGTSTTPTGKRGPGRPKKGKKIKKADPRWADPNVDVEELLGGSGQGVDDPNVKEIGDKPVWGRRILPGYVVVPQRQFTDSDGKERIIEAIAEDRFDGEPEQFNVIVRDAADPDKIVHIENVSTADEAAAIAQQIAEGNVKFDDNFVIPDLDAPPLKLDVVNLPPDERVRIILSGDAHLWQQENYIYADAANQAQLGDRVRHFYDPWGREGVVMGFETIHNPGDRARKGYVLVKFDDGTYAVWSTGMLFLNGRNPRMNGVAGARPTKSIAPRPKISPTRRRQYALRNRYEVRRVKKVDANGNAILSPTGKVQYELRVIPYVSYDKDNWAGETRRAYRLWKQRIERINEYRRSKGLPVMSPDDPNMQLMQHPEPWARALFRRAIGDESKFDWVRNQTGDGGDEGPLNPAVPNPVTIEPVEERPDVPGAPSVEAPAAKQYQVGDVDSEIGTISRVIPLEIDAFVGSGEVYEADNGIKVKFTVDMGEGEKYTYDVNLPFSKFDPDAGITADNVAKMLANRLTEGDMSGISRFLDNPRNFDGNPDNPIGFDKPTPGMDFMDVPALNPRTNSNQAIVDFVRHARAYLRGDFSKERFLDDIRYLKSVYSSDSMRQQFNEVFDEFVRQYPEFAGVDIDELDVSRVVSDIFGSNHILTESKRDKLYALANEIDSYLYSRVYSNEYSPSQKQQLERALSAFTALKSMLARVDIAAASSGEFADPSFSRADRLSELRSQLKYVLQELDAAKEILGEVYNSPEMSDFAVEVRGGKIRGNSMEKLLDGLKDKLSKVADNVEILANVNESKVSPSVDIPEASEESFDNADAVVLDNLAAVVDHLENGWAKDFLLEDGSVNPDKYYPGVMADVEVFLSAKKALEYYQSKFAKNPKSLNSNDVIVLRKLAAKAQIEGLDPRVGGAAEALSDLADFVGLYSEANPTPRFDGVDAAKIRKDRAEAGENKFSLDSDTALHLVDAIDKVVVDKGALDELNEFFADGADDLSLAKLSPKALNNLANAIILALNKERFAASQESIARSKALAKLLMQVNDEVAAGNPPIQNFNEDAVNLLNNVDFDFIKDNFGYDDDIIVNGVDTGFVVAPLGNKGVNDILRLRHKATGQIYWLKRERLNLAGAAGDEAAAAIFNGLGAIGVPNILRHPDKPEIFMMTNVGDENPDIKVLGTHSEGRGVIDAGIDPGSVLRILLFDALFGNEDRHGNNFMIVEMPDEHGGRQVAVPIDNGILPFVGETFPGKRKKIKKYSDEEWSEYWEKVRNGLKVRDYLRGRGRSRLNVPRLLGKLKNEVGEVAMVELAMLSAQQYIQYLNRIGANDLGMTQSQFDELVERAEELASFTNQDWLSFLSNWR